MSTSHKHTDTGQQLVPTNSKALTLVLTALAVLAIFYTQLGAGPATASRPLIELPGKANAWAAMTVAVAVQSLPFLVLGVIISALIATFAPVNVLQRWSPRSSFLTVPAASVVAIALPGCECSAVPVARSLMRRGLSPAGALSFLLASPSINPVVIVSTAVAFYALPEMAWARFIASFIGVILAGWMWQACGSNSLIKADATGATDCDCATHQHGSGNSHGADPRKARRWDTFREACLHDLTQAGGFLVLGAMIAGLIKVFLPAAWFAQLSKNPLLTILVMALFAIVLSLCSEADAFVAASFTAVSPTAQLAFLVVGPVVDIKLFAMQVGAFGWRFTRLFLPIVLGSALISATAVGVLVFGSL